MRLRFGALAMRPHGAGVSTYAREFMRAATPLLGGAQLSALVQRDAATQLPVTVKPVRRPVQAGIVRAAFAAMPVRDVDLFHSLDVDLPVYSSGLRVATVHDLSVYDTPWAFTRTRYFGEREILRASLRVADVVVAVSEFTAERLRSVLGREALVVPLAAASWARPASAEEVRDVRSRLRLPETFVLQVATVEPRKNVALVAAAARELDLPCVLAGSGSDGADAPAGVIGLGYVDEADLPALYSAATVVAYASRYEGFGLPPLEALACGAAVVASRCGALPEFAGDAAVLIGSQRVDDWSRAIRRLIVDPAEREEMRTRGIAAAARLTWDQTAKRSLAAYRAAGASV